MASSLYTALLLSLIYAAIHSSSAEQIQFNASVLSNCTSWQNCIYSWNNSSIWIGGKVPSSNDDVIITIGKNNVIITCDTNCIAQTVITSGSALTFQMPGATSATFDQVLGIGGGIEFDGGLLRVKNLTNQNNSLVFCQFKNIDVAVDNMHVTAVQFVSATAKIGSITIQSSLMLFYAQLTLQNHADIFDIMSIEGSTLTIQGGCSVPDVTPSSVVNSTVNVTPACPLAPGSSTSLYSSQWNIASHARSAYTIASQFNLVNSTIKLTGVTLSVKSNINLRNSSVIDADSPIEISYGGSIGGEGSVLGDVAVKNFGRIQSRYSLEDQSLFHLKLNIKGSLTLDQSASIYLQQFESIQANSILCGDSSLEISFYMPDWNINELNYTVITATQGEISGSFGFMNVTAAVGYSRFMNTKSDLTVLWQRNPPVPHAPHSINEPIGAVPLSVNQPVTNPVAEDIPPHAEQDPENDTKTVIIVIESIMIGLGLILGGALLYRRFIKRRNYTQVPNFDQL